MNNIDINSLDNSSLKKLLKELNNYKNLSKKLGKRGKKIFLDILNQNKVFKVEYYPGVSKEDIYKNALDVYKKIFNETPNIEKIEFVERKNLLGGMRIFFNDKMIDMSFLKIQKSFKI